MKEPKFKSLLDQQYTWPDYYTFKFVVQTDKKDDLLALLKGHKLTEKLSKNGKFTSISSRLYVENSDQIMEIYLAVKNLDGILSI